MMRLTRRHAVTLFELLVALVFVSLTYVGLAQLMSHSLHLSERAAMRSVLTNAALDELERLRAETSLHSKYRPDHVRLIPGRRIRLTATNDSVVDAPLLAIRVVAEALHTDPPFRVTLTGWVNRP
jgi:Tfp pilus assembly protein PilV